MARKKKDTVPVIVESQKQPPVFKYERLSASMMKTWLQCKRKFYCNYVLKEYNPPQEHFTLGLAVHSVLEEVNKSIKKNPRSLNAFEIEDYIQLFRDTAAKNFVLNTSLFEVGEEILRSELIKPNKEELLGIEMEFDLTTPEGVRIYGFMDKVVKIDDTTVKIIDYKTSQNPMSYEDARTDEQIAMYDLAVSMLYPDIPKRIVELHYVRTDDRVSIVKSDSERKSFRLILLSVNKAILEFLQNLDPAVLNGDVNSYCSWCSFKDGCPNYNKYKNTMLPEVAASLELTDDTFIEKWSFVSNIINIAEKWKDELKLWAAMRLEMDPGTTIENGEKEVYMSSSTRRDYDTVGICKLIDLKDLLGAATDGNPIVKINTKALDQYLKIKKDKKLLAKVEKYTTIKFNSPSIRLKNKR